MTVSKISVVLRAALLTLFLAGSAGATTFYVDNAAGHNGSDGNLCTSEAAPCATIQGAINKAQIEGTVSAGAGDTVLIKDGSGNYPTPWRISKGGSSGSYFTVKNYPGHNPKIRMSTQTFQQSGGTLASTLQIVVEPSGFPTMGWIWIEGLEVSNGWFCFHNNFIDNSVFTRNIVHDCGQGILGGGYRVSLINNTIYHNGVWQNCPSSCNQSHGIYVSGHEMLIANNVIWQNSAYGIQCTNYTSPVGVPQTYSGCKNNTFANNTIAYESHRAAMVLANDASSTEFPPSGNRITNNIFYENVSVASWRSTANQGVDFESMSASNATLDNNVYYASWTTGVWYGNGGGTPGFGTGADANINSNPLLTNAPTSPIPTTPDFHLTASSPARDMGANLAALGVTVDIEGNPRPAGSGYDAGAYEYGTTSLPDLTPPATPSNLTVE